jgi:hypothetical protein
MWDGEVPYFKSFLDHKIELHIVEKLFRVLELVNMRTRYTACVS